MKYILCAIGLLMSVNSVVYSAESDECFKVVYNNNHHEGLNIMAIQQGMERMPSIWKEIL